MSFEEIAGHLHAEEHEARGHQDGIGGKGSAAEAGGPPPVAHRDQNGAECEHLPDLDTHIKRDEIGDEAVGRQREVLQLRRQAEAMEEAEDQDRRLRIGLDTEPALIGAEIVERFIDDREADDRVDEISADMGAHQHARNQRGAVPHREQRHIGRDVLHPVEEEDHPEEEEEVIVAGDHMLGPEIEERADLGPARLFDIALVTRRHAVRERSGHGEARSHERKARIGGPPHNFHVHESSIQSARGNRERECTTCGRSASAAALGRSGGFGWLERRR